MKTFKFLWVVFLLLLLNVTKAQQQKAAGALKVGDKVPDVVFSYMLYNSSGAKRLSDFKDKLVILDFWSSWCGACISLMPHMDSLQRKFGSKIQILLVNQQSRANKDDETKIRKIIQGIKDRTGRAINLPVVFNCSDLDSYFPAKFLPHEVWINKKGIVEAITPSFDVNENNIQSILVNGKISLHNKQDDFSYDHTKPLFIQGNGGNTTDIKCRSILTGYQEGIGGISTRWSSENVNKLIGYSLMNVSVSALTEIAFGEKLGKFPLNRRIFDLTKPEMFVNHDLDSLKYRFQYCYDIMVPPTSLETIYIYIQQDIKRYFGIQLEYKKKKMKCWAVYFSDKLKNIYSKHIERDADYYDYGAVLKKKFMHYYSINEVLSVLDLFNKQPIIDETGISDQKIDVDFPDNFDLNNEKAVVDLLKSIGFDIKEEERELDVVVITDK